MRLSSAHAAAAALTAVVAAGLLAMPSRLLGPDQARLTPISLPRPASATIVVAAPPVVERPRKPAPPPAPVAQLASVVVHRSTPTPKLPVTHKRVVVRPAPTAGVTVLNRVRRHPLPADEARATTAPAPAPVPVHPPHHRLRRPLRPRPRRPRRGSSPTRRPLPLQRAGSAPRTAARSIRPEAARSTGTAPGASSRPTLRGRAGERAGQRAGERTGQRTGSRQEVSAAGASESRTMPRCRARHSPAASARSGRRSSSGTSGAGSRPRSAAGSSSRHASTGLAWSSRRWTPRRTAAGGSA